MGPFTPEKDTGLLSAIFLEIFGMADAPPQAEKKEKKQKAKAAPAGPVEIPQFMKDRLAIFERIQAANKVASMSGLFVFSQATKTEFLMPTF